MSKQLIKSTSIVAGFTLLSRISGFVRDIILANIFGAGGLFDAFVVAFRFPNFLRRLFAEGAFSQAFVPILASFRSNNSQEEVQSFVDHVSGTLTTVVMLLIIVSEVIAPLMIMFFAPGFFHDPLRFGACVNLFRILFPYLILIVLTAFSGAVLNTFGSFGPAAFAPILLNLSMIGVALLWAPYSSSPIYTLAYGVIIGGIMQLCVQIPFLKKEGIIPKFKLGFHHEGTRRVMSRMVPALFGVSVAQLGLLIDNIFASFLPSGSISWLYYSDRLIYFPQGIIGAALATVVLPYLSRHHAKQDEQTFSHTLDWALRCVLFIGVPASVGLFVLSGPILATLIHYGKFSAFDVVMTSKSLMAFSVGLPGFMSIKVLASGFYSRHNIRTPVKVAAIAMVVNLSLNAVLIFPLKHAGLALATSLSSLLNAVLLCFLLIRQGAYRPQGRWCFMMIALLCANVAMGVLIYWLSSPLPVWLSWHAMTRAAHLTGIVIIGVVSYLAMLWVFGVKLRDFQPDEQ